MNKTLILIILLAIALRVVALDKNPIELFGDEVDAGYQAYSLLTTGRDYKGNLLPIYIQSFSEWRAPLLMYSMVPFVGIFGLNEWGVRLTAAFWGVIGIVGFYLLLGELAVNQKVRLVSTLFLAISPWHIQYSRAGYELTLLLTLIIYGALFLIRSLRSGRLIYWLLAAVFFGLSFYTYSTANIFVPIIVIGILYFIRCDFHNNRQGWQRLLLFITTIFIIAAPLVSSIFLGHAADRFQKFSVFSDETIVDQINRSRTAPGENKFLGIIFQNKPVFWAKKIVANYLNAYSSDFLFGHGDVTFRQSLHEVGGFFWTEAFLIVIGIVTILRKKTLEMSEKIMIFWLLAAPLPSSLTVDGAYHASRLFYMIFPLVFLASVGFVWLWDRKKIILTVVVLALLFEFFNYEHYYWVKYPQESWRWWQYGYKEAIADIKSETALNKYNKVLIESTYEPAYIRYLFWMKVDPKMIFRVSDEMKPNAIDGFNGFCLPNTTACFVNFLGTPPQELLKKGNLYLISQEKNVPGDWDWEKSPPNNVKVLRTIRNPYGYPIFYLVTHS